MRLRRNPSFEREILATREAKHSLEQAAENVAKATRQVAKTFERTGHYERSISTDGKHVTTSDFAAHLIEFGSVNNPPYAPLRRGIRAAGLRFDDTPNQ